MSNTTFYLVCVCEGGERKGVPRFIWLNGIPDSKYDPKSKQKMEVGIDDNFAHLNKDLSRTLFLFSAQARVWM